MQKGSTEKTAIDGIALILFIILILLPGFSLQSADWTDNLHILTSVGTLGALAGTALALSTFSGRTVSLFNTVYWVFIMGWQLGNTLDPALIWKDRIISLLGRLGVFIETLIQGGRNQDPLIFVFLMGTLLWFMGSIGVWRLFRKQGFWIAVIPPGIALFLNQIFYLGSTKLDGYLIFYVLTVLILSSRVEIWRRQVLWRKLRAQVAPDTLYAFSRTSVMLAILIVFLAWGAPAFAQSEPAAKIWSAITSPFDKIRETVADAFGGLRGSIGVSLHTYGDSLHLGAGVEPADFLIMHITAEEMPKSGGRFYWYSRAYNIYESGRWTMSIGENVDFDPDGGDLPLPPYNARQIVQVEVSPKVASIHGLYIPSQPVWSSRSGESDLYLIPDGTVDVIRMTTDGVIRNGESYQARASIAIPTANELREASQDYPDWVVENYLQVPTSITERTRNLAASITDGLDTPFAKTVAITRWLRQNIEYKRETLPPPEGVEQIDWLLFDYKVGFCNWYASAEVILLRTLGIPSRMAVGYARGTFHASEGYFEVKGEDAHAWPEIYFPGYGWVEFEPTGNQGVLNRPEDRDPSESESGARTNPYRDLEELLNPSENTPQFDNIDTGNLNLGNQINYAALLSWSLLGIALFSGLIFVWLKFDPVSRVTALTRVIAGLERIGIQPPQVMRHQYKYDLTPNGKIYSRWSIWVRRLGISLNQFQTPNERAEAFGRKFPTVSTLGWRIVNTYVAERFGGAGTESDELKEIWRELHPYLMLEWIGNKIGIKSKLVSQTHSDVTQSFP
jgi:hypothetical protein